MKTSPALRWACYAIAAAATAAAMWHVDHRADEADAIQAVRPAQRGLGMPVAASRPAASPDALALLKQRLDAALSGSADPFSDNRPVAPAAPAPAQVAAAAPVAPAAPAMPFSYVGRWVDQGRTEVFLQAGGRVLSVTSPGPLDGGYAVEKIGPESLTIKGSGGERYIVTYAAAAAPPSGDAGAAPGPAMQTTTASSPSGAPEEN